MPFADKEKQREYQRKYQRKRRRTQQSDYETEEGAPSVSPEVKLAIWVVILFAFAILSFLSFFDLAGLFGEYSKAVLILAFGWGAYLFPVLLIAIGALLLKGAWYSFSKWELLGVFLLFLSILGIMHHMPGFEDPVTAVSQGAGGGYFGFGVVYPLARFVGYWGAWVVLAVLLAVGILLSFSSFVFDRKEEEEEETVETEAEEETEEEPGFFGKIKETLAVWRYKRAYDQDEEEADAPEEVEETEEAAEEEEASGEETTEEKKEGGAEPEPITTPKRFRRSIQIPLDLLEAATEKPTADDVDVVREKIAKTFGTFGIQVVMDEVNVGPTVTQYTLRPPAGVKLSRLTGLANELALSLAAHPLRMEAPIPGKSLVGIEIPNQVSAKVKLKDILVSGSFKKRSSNLSICIGKDVAGKAWVADLSKMPHLLIAGSTGSGKSVAINSIIISLLYQNSPDDLKIVLVDPKKVELTSYNDIPYLLTPVITDVKKTVNALKWVVSEMERRYQLLSTRGKRNIEAYNAANKKDSIPYIVFIIDELADLMSVAAHEVEAAIVRLAQMARAVGIHLVLATQRPSVNVITGLIKANIPSRMAFAVPSQIDSRTILDTAGAEKLLGRGDMLYTASDANKPRRLQGAFLEDEEIERVVSFLKEQGEAEYHDEVTEKQQTGPGASAGGDTDADDDLYYDAKEEVMRAGKASASLLQRRLRIGYARAARLLDILEAEGVIGPADGAKPREVFTGSDTQGEEVYGDYAEGQDEPAGHEEEGSAGEEEGGNYS